MFDLEQDEAAWVLKEVRAIKREQRLSDQVPSIKPTEKPQLELPLSEKLPTDKPRAGK